MHVLIGHSCKQHKIKHCRKEFEGCRNYGNYRKPIEIEARENGRTKHHRKKTMNNEKQRTQEIGYKPPQNPLKMLPNKRPSGGSSGLYVSPVPQSFGLKQRTQEDQPNRAKKNLVQTQ